MSGAGPWQLLAQGIQDTTGHFVGRRDRSHMEHREDRFRREDRYNFLRDREHAEEFDSQYFQRRVADAKLAGLSPSAVIGAQVSGPAFAQTAQSYGGGRADYPKYSPVDLSALDVNTAQAAKLRAETSLIKQQARDSQLARTISRTTPEAFTRLPGGDIPASDPHFFAEDAERKWGQISDIDGALMRLIDALNFTTGSLFVDPVMSSKAHPYSKHDPVFSTYE